MGRRQVFEPREAGRREPERDEEKRAGHQAVLVEVLHDGNAPEDGSHDEREHVHAARVGFSTVCRCLAETRQDSSEREEECAACSDCEAEHILYVEADRTSEDGEHEWSVFPTSQSARHGRT